MGLGKCKETLAGQVSPEGREMECGWVGFTDRVKSRTAVQQCASPARYFPLLSATEARRPSDFSLLHKQVAYRGIQRLGGGTLTLQARIRLVKSVACIKLRNQSWRSCGQLSTPQPWRMHGTFWTSRRHQMTSGTRSGSHRGAPTASVKTNPEPKAPGRVSDQRLEP